MEKGYVSSQMLCSTFASSYLSKHGETIFLNHILMLGFNILTSDLNKLFEKVIRGEKSIQILKEQLLLMFISVLLYWNNLYLGQ